MEVSAPLFMTAWVVMLLAMMLPTVTPMVVTYQRITAASASPRAAPVVFVLGHVLVWTVAGLLPLTFNLYVPALRMSIGNGGWTILIAATFLVVGLYQLTPWKNACLRSCRAPLAFFVRYDFGEGAGAAAKLGGLHGVICLGCCWALMALMVVAGAMSVAWMAGLGVVFFAEKTWRHGIVLSRAVGLGALGAAALISVTGWGVG
jgi:predicted metal-binding membrane protein